jgi:DNA-directed RNA polymerase subunit K/omega
VEGQGPHGSLYLATVMFLRVAQLRAGARPRVDSAGHKLLRVALLEVTTGAIPWRA